MLVVKLLAIAFALSLAACKTTNDSSRAEGLATKTERVPVPTYDLLASIGGSTARSAFDGLAETAHSQGDTEVKRADGNFAIKCLQTNGGYATTGGRASATCTVTRTSGQPQATVLNLKGAAAGDLWEELNLVEQDGVKEWAGAASIECMHFTTENSHYCQLKDLSGDGDLPLGSPGLASRPVGDDEDALFVPSSRDSKAQWADDED